jgi:hypothetical protein
LIGRPSHNGETFFDFECVSAGEKKTAQIRGADKLNLPSRFADKKNKTLTVQLSAILTVVMMVEGLSLWSSDRINSDSRPTARSLELVYAPGFQKHTQNTWSKMMIGAVLQDNIDV